MTTDVEGTSKRGAVEKDRIDQLTDAAQMVQGFAYDLVGHLDPITTTELMATSRKLERLAERLSKDPDVLASVTKLAGRGACTEG